MSYPTQHGALNRMEAETRKAGRKHEDACVNKLLRSWSACKDALRGIILSEYHLGHRGGPWTLNQAGPTLERMGHFCANRLVAFHNDALALVRKSLADSYRQEALRQVWMLDMLTPPSYKPKLPARSLREAIAPKYRAGWDQVLGEWLRAYLANLATNLRLEALHSGSLTDAADEVDSAKVDGFDPSYKFSSMLTNQILQAQREARSDVADSNDDIVTEEIFQTMEDSAVCDDCDSQDGKRVEDVDTMLPHVYGFRCRCFERIVPCDFAELLRNGTDDEKQAALDMDARGLVPDSMPIRDPDTEKLKARLYVEFDKWQEQQSDLNIMGRSGAAQGEQ